MREVCAGVSVGVVCCSLLAYGRIVGVAELMLTAERRNELAELLDDVRRLRIEYPKVAEYLEVAPMLSGTGDSEVDAAFDLRFVHYMTGGKSASRNPYWEIVEPAVSVLNGRRVVSGGQSTGSVRFAFAETVLQSVYAYAIPSPETVEWVSRFCGDLPVIELGAGRGYWAAQLARIGVVVDAYDSHPPHVSENVSHAAAVGQLDVWHPVGGLMDFAARPNGASGAVLFFCWPPGWGDTMASSALAMFERQGGERLVFLGEPKGGKTGDAAFFDALSQGWKFVSQDEQYVSWWNLADVAQGWIRR